MFLAKVAIGADTLQAGGAALANSRAISPVEILMTFVGLFILFRLFNVRAKKENSPRPQAVTPVKSLMDLVTEEVGDLQPAGTNSLVGGKLMENKDDIETYIFVAKIDKAAEEAEKAKLEKLAKAKKGKKSEGYGISGLLFIAFATLTLLYAMAYFVKFLN